MDEARTRGMRGEVAGAEQPVLLAGHREEHERSPQADARFAQPPRDLEERGRARRVVHGAVVDGVAVHRFAAPDVIEVCAEHHVLAGQLAVRAAQNPDHVVGSQRSH